MTLVLSWAVCILLCLTASPTSSRAMRSSETALNSSPGAGTSARPVISTGTEGPAVFTVRPLSSVITRTRPTAVPAMITSPWFRVPFWIRRVAMGPRVRSSRASMTVPLAGAVGVGLQLLHLGSEDDHLQQLVNALAGLGGDGGQITVSPPHSSGTRSYSVSRA